MMCAREDTRSAGVIDAYVAELNAALRGPRRAQADLVAEARDSLVDAAEAYERRGLDRMAAERQAVQEFGDVAEIAPGYRTELGLAQGQRTALLIICVVAPQSFVWSHVSGWVLGPMRWNPGPGYALVDGLMPWIGITSIALSLFVAVACGIGVRYLDVPRDLVRATGAFAFLVSAVGAVSAVLLTLLSPAPVGTGLLLVTVIVLLPLLGIALSARRCLTAA